MKIGVLVFIDNMLGGLGMQAYDLAKTAFELGHEARVIVFSETKISFGNRPGRFTARFGPNERGTNLVIRDVQVSSHPEQWAQTVDYLKQYDLLIWMGVAPHCLDEDDKVPLYDHILSLPCRHVAFATDRFIETLYPWVKSWLQEFDALLAFAEPYAKALRDAGAPNVKVVPICPLESWKQRQLVAMSAKTILNFWPHQWRGWKNINLFLEIAPSFGFPVDVYASGSGIEYSQYKKSEAYAKNVILDRHNPEHKNPNGTLLLKGYAPHAEIIEAYKKAKSVLDLTGIAQLSHKANSYVGNYQCATLEAMCYGCAMIKLESTVAPFNCLPEEAAVVLPVGLTTEEYGKLVCEVIRDDVRLAEAAGAAFAWIEQSTDPYALFKTHFIG